MLSHPSPQLRRLQAMVTEVCDDNISADNSPLSGSSPASSASSTRSFHSDPQDIHERLTTWWEECFLPTLEEAERAAASLPHLPPRIPEIYRLEEYRKSYPAKFRRTLRVKPETFDALVNLIEHHPIYGGNTTKLPPALQLAIFLNRAGHYGNQSTLEEVADWSGVSATTVDDCTKRTIIALLDLHDDAFGPLSAEDARRSRDYVTSRSCEAWAGGKFVGDGTMVPLFQKPSVHGDTWLDRKARYSMSVQLVCWPHSFLFVDYCVGYPGSVHDAHAFRDSHIFRDPGSFLAPGEWVWLDSAYPSQDWSVSPFRTPVRGQLSREQRTFNRYLSKIRVRSEHAIGALKARFQSLKELRIRISSKKAHEFANLWIVCCLILHNLVIQIERIEQQTGPESFDAEDEENEIEPTSTEDYDEAGDDHAEETEEVQFVHQSGGSTEYHSSGQGLRERVMATLFDSLANPVPQ